MSDSIHSFARLAAINVNEHVERKGGFAYLSWPYAVAQLRAARYPAARIGHLTDRPGRITLVHGRGVSGPLERDRRGGRSGPPG